MQKPASTGQHLSCTRPAQTCRPIHDHYQSQKVPPLITSFVKAYLQGAQSTCSDFIFSTTHWLYSLEKRETWKGEGHPCVSFQETEAGAVLEVAHSCASGWRLGAVPHRGVCSVSRMRLGPRPSPASPFCRAALRSEQPAQRYLAALLSYLTEISLS